MTKYLSLIILFYLSACSFIQNHSLRKPDNIYTLKKELKEISGLSYISKEKMVAIQDENGFIYSLDFDQFKKQDKIPFSKKGDYEGIASTLDRYYILKSNGTIISVNLKGKDKKNYKPPHKAKIEFEGLCFDSKKNRLLILCKEHSSKKKNKNINIYSFDLSTEKFSTKPVLSIDKKLVDIHRSMGLLPSGIAINPMDGYIYILASVGKKLIMIDNNGKLIHYYNLDETIYKQPEGITFTKTGELYIACEGKVGKAQVMHFISIP